jgi:hypothetical protein
VAHPNKRRRSKAHGTTNTLRWLLAGAAGAVLLIIAALTLASRQNSSGAAGQKAFDPNFEPEVRGAPRVDVLPQEVIDYGDVKLGTTITTTYQVRNMGDRPLVILGEPQVELVQGC